MIVNGGPAFPPMHDPDTHASGMTLRDYFAACALQGICASGPAPLWSDDLLAREAYALADAMLKARGETK